MAQDDYFMTIALGQAEEAMTRGEVPVGAVIVRGGEVVAEASNGKEAAGDPTGHAEISVLREAARRGLGWRLNDATLYVTKEPCVMCAGAMVNARLGRLVFGCRDRKGGAVTSLYRILSDARLNHRVEFLAGVMEEECASLLRRFFVELRQKRRTAP